MNSICPVQNEIRWESYKRSDIVRSRQKWVLGILILTSLEIIILLASGASKEILQYGTRDSIYGKNILNEVVTLIPVLHISVDILSVCIRNDCYNRRTSRIPELFRSPERLQLSDSATTLLYVKAVGHFDFSLENGLACDVGLRHERKFFSIFLMSVGWFTLLMSGTVLYCAIYLLFLMSRNSSLYYYIDKRHIVCPSGVSWVYLQKVLKRIRSDSRRSETLVFLLNIFSLITFWGGCLVSWCGVSINLTSECENGFCSSFEEAIKSLATAVDQEGIRTYCKLGISFFFLYVCTGIAAVVAIIAVWFRISVRRDDQRRRVKQAIVYLTDLCEGLKNGSVVVDSNNSPGSSKFLLTFQTLKDEIIFSAKEEQWMKMDEEKRNGASPFKEAVEDTTKDTYLHPVVENKPACYRNIDSHSLEYGNPFMNLVSLEAQKRDAIARYEVVSLVRLVRRANREGTAA